MVAVGGCPIATNLTTSTETTAVQTTPTSTSRALTVRISCGCPDYRYYAYNVRRKQSWKLKYV
jgi:hypothetical protein